MVESVTRLADDKVKVAVVGTGKIAETAHIPAYLSSKIVDLVALVDVDSKKAKKTARKFGIEKVFPSVEELFEKETIDAISLCTPPNTHAEIALKAFDSGIHVLCEKPLSTSIEDGKMMVEASRRKERILMVGFNRRFWPNYTRAKKYISGGKLGHIYLAADHYVQSDPLVRWGKSPWFHVPGVGGALLDLSPHVFDMLNYIFGDFPVAVSARSLTYLDSSVEECVVCVLEYPQKGIGVGAFSWLSPKPIEQLSVYGTASNLFASPEYFLENNRTDMFQVAAWREASEVLIGMKFPNLPGLRTRLVNTYELEIDYFVDQVKKENISSSNALDALNVTITYFSTKKSLETNKRIEIEPTLKA